MFDGTLGSWKSNPYSIHLKEGVTPYHGKPYKLPQIHEQKLKVEVERLCRIWVLKLGWELRVPDTALESRKLRRITA